MEERNSIQQDSFGRNLEMISSRLRKGLSPLELESISSLPVSRDWNVRDLIEANLRSGYIKLIEGRLTTTSATFKINLSEEEEDVVNQKAIEYGLSAEELIRKIIGMGLVQI